MCQQRSPERSQQQNVLIVGVLGMCRRNPAHHIQKNVWSADDFSPLHQSNDHWIQQQPLNFLTTTLYRIITTPAQAPPYNRERFFHFINQIPSFHFLKIKIRTKRSGKSKVTRKRQRPGNAGLPGTSELSTNKVSRFHTMPMHLNWFLAQRSSSSHQNIN